MNTNESNQNDTEKVQKPKINLPPQEKIDAWKAKYKVPKLILLTVTDRDNKQYGALFREATLEDLRRAKESENRQVLTFGLSLYNNCKLWCEPEIEESEYLTKALILEMDKVQVTAPVEVGNV